MLRFALILFLFGISAAAADRTKTPLDQTQSDIDADVIQSQIDGDFEGWHGDTTVKLINGQIWKQVEYRYEYRYAYMPDVLIYWSEDGYKMQVDGMDEAVAVVLVK